MREFKMPKKIWLWLALCGISTCAVADEAELYLSDDSVQGRYITSAGRIGISTGELGAELLINEQDDVSAAVDLSFIGAPAGMTSWTFSAGPKLYAATLDAFSVDENYAAVAIGASAAYALPLKVPVQVTGQYYIAPKITTVGDAEDLSDFIIRVETQFSESVTGFLGFRLLRTDLEDSTDHDLDDQVHIGVRLAF
jgi:hypothetical protein